MNITKTITEMRMTEFSSFHRNFKRFLTKDWIVSSSRSPDISEPKYLGTAIRPAFECMATDAVDFIVKPYC